MGLCASSSRLYMMGSISSKDLFIMKATGKVLLWKQNGVVQKQ